MPTDTVSEWNVRLGELENTFATVLKQLRKRSADPFELAERLRTVKEIVGAAGIDMDRVLDAVQSGLAARCVQLEAEFWGALSKECAERGWDLHGSTNRRLVNKAVFVVLEGNNVKVEGVGAAGTPFFPSVMPTLERVLDDLKASETETSSFFAILAKAYDALPRSGVESGLEAVYRQCVLEVQRPNFWRNPTAPAFIALSRPAFRYRVSEILRLGLSTPDGRAMVLGTTTTTKDAWEIYSPGEQRVVIAGRISLLRLGGSDER